MKKISYIACMLLLVTACKKQLAISSSTKVTNYLVVDGNISSGDSTFITLSRTVNLDSGARSKPELNAVVTVKGSAGENYSLIGKNNGYYVCAPLNLLANEKYSLEIVSSDGRKYQSDFVQVKNAPVIDSIPYVAKSNGLQLSVDTHDATNNTKYYRWDYIETYNIRTAFESKFIVIDPNSGPPSDIGPRMSQQQVYNCWISDTSSNIITNSSAKLLKDVISESPIINIPSTSEKLHKRYSILVKQYALTSDAFDYYELLKKNTEQIGGVFDAQPSQLTGNIHCISNPTEPVIGFVTAGKVAQKRIFIENSNLPAGWAAITPYTGCELHTLLYKRLVVSPNPAIPDTFINEVYNLIYPGTEIPIDAASGGYTTSSAECVDCTLRGTNKKPLFW